MLKIKKHTDNKIFSIELHKDTVSLSWRYMTTNKNFTLDYFKSNIRNKCKAMEDIFTLANEISSHNWINLLGRGKENFGGCESLKVNQLNFSPSDYKFSKDEKILSFRFSNNHYRLVGIQKNDILYVIGYDFNYSAYNHGS